MDGFRRFLLRLTSPFRSREAEADLAREIQSHLQIIEDKFMAQGMTPEDARRAARRTFGGVEQAKERQRDARSFRWLENSRLDFKLGARMLIKYPGLTLVGGLGMAVATAIGVVSFALFYSYIHPTLPLHEGARVVGLENWDAAANNQDDRSLHDFITWRDELRTMEQVSAFRPIERNLLVPGRLAEPVSVAEMTASGFRVARVAPFLGRSLVAEDERKGAPPVAVIGYEVWRTRFASDPSAVGRSVRLGNATYTVVGIMPEGFAFPLNNELWIPLKADPADYLRRRGPYLQVFGRLAPGFSLEEAQAELATIGQRTAVAFPETHKHIRPRIVRYTELWFDDGSRSQLHVVQLLISMLLVVVWVNVAVLVYARTATRQVEIAVRCALGATRARIAAQLFIEALVLSAAATAAGLGLAKVALWRLDEVIVQFSVPFGGPPFWIDFGLSSEAVAYALALTILGALIVGVPPAAKATGRQIDLKLRELGRGSGMRLGKTWTALIVLQVAFAVTVLPAALFHVSQFVRYGNARPGIAAEQFLTARLVLDRETPPSTEARSYLRQHLSRYRHLQTDLLKRLEAEPDASAAIFMTGVPGWEPSARIALDDLPAAAPAGSGGRIPSGEAGQVVGVGRVDIGFFEVFNVATLAGRRFHSADFGALPRGEPSDTDGDGDADGPGPGAAATAAVIVNRSFVQRVLGGGNALGRRVRYVGEEKNEDSRDAAAVRWYEIVGVVADFPANAMEPDLTEAKMYHPLAPEQDHPERLAIRLRGRAPSTFSGRLREITAELDPALRLRGMLPLDQVLTEEQAAMRMGAVALSLVTLSVLLLSAAGIYALMSVTVTRRRKEIGIRIALGANPRSVLQSIFARSLGQLGIGVVAGFPAAFLLDLAGDAELTAGQWAVLLPVVALFMTAVGLLAAWGPARRGLRIQPMDALREE